MLLRGGRLVDPSQDLDANLDLRLRDGLVAEIGEHLPAFDEDDVIDVTGMIVAPGFIDMHVHLRDPGFPEKETVATGARAAARGGFTAVACMPNTLPALDDAATIVALATRIAAQHDARVYPIGAITRGRSGAVPVDFAALAAAGAVAFSDDGDTVADAGVLRAAARRAAGVPGVFISHCEDADLKGNAVMHEGAVARELGLAGAPAIAEDAIVARDLLIALDTEKAWHVAHVSTRGALAMLACARTFGAVATCEVTPHHLLLTDAAVRESGARAKVNPPLRTEADARTLRDAVREGAIDVFASDHAPHTAGEKGGDFASAAVGFSGLEVAVGAYDRALPDLPLPRFVALLSANPARVLGVPGGTLRAGSVADVTVFAQRAWTVDARAFASKGKSTPFDGWTFARRPMATIVGGTLRYADASMR